MATKKLLIEKESNASRISSWKSGDFTASVDSPYVNLVMKSNDRQRDIFDRSKNVLVSLFCLKTVDNVSIDSQICGSNSKTLFLENGLLINRLRVECSLGSAV